MKLQLSVRRLVYAALFCALACAATLVIQIPLLTGYVHPGDAICLLSGFLLPGWSGVLAAALGSALADLASGYAIYIPATFVAKGAVALLAQLLLRQINKGTDGRRMWLGALIGGLVGEAAMVAAYFAYESLLYGVGTAIMTIPGNALQGAFGILLAVPLCCTLKKRLPLE